MSEENEEDIGVLFDEDCGDEEEPESDYDEKVQKSIDNILDELIVELDMKEWSVNLNYIPDEESEAVADVSYSIHKEAEINLYHFRPELVRIDLTHELMHCKIGIAKRSYETIIAYQRKMIEDLAQGYEEQVVDDLTRMVSKYSKESRPKQLDLFPKKGD